MCHGNERRRARALLNLGVFGPPPNTASPTYNTRSHLEMLAYDRAAHLPDRPMSRLEADEVEVEPIVELAPMLAAVNAARCDAAESATTTPPDAPGP